MSLKKLIALASVVLIAAVVPASASNDPGFNKQWGLAKIQAEQAWATGSGSGIVIAVVDTGVDLAHEDLKDKIVPGIDCVGGCREGSSGQDAEGHGTHVAGIAAAATSNNRGIAGTAPTARIMPVRVLDENGRGTAADISSGIRWAADHGAKVINLSLGGPAQAFSGPGSTFGSALEYAWSRGVIPVVAAGNQFLLSSGYSEHNAIVVTATDRNDAKPDFASVVGSAKWGMAAPGGASNVDPANPFGVTTNTNDIFSTYWDYEKPNDHNLYAYAPGTSMSAPFVSGAAAVLRGLGLSPQATVDRLLATADDVGPSGRDSTFGYGRLNLARAVQGLGSSSSSGSSGTGVAPGKKRGGTIAAATPAATLSPSAPAPLPATPTASVVPEPSDPGSQPLGGGASEDEGIDLWPMLALVLLAGSSTGLFMHHRARSGG